MGWLVEGVGGDGRLIKNIAPKKWRHTQAKQAIDQYVRTYLPTCGLLLEGAAMVTSRTDGSCSW